MQKFKAEIEIIGINPFVFVPEILAFICKQAGKNKGHIPIYGTVNGKHYTQTLVKFRGAWRLYINTTMLTDSPKHIGETIEITAAFDHIERKIKTHPKLIKALNDNPEAKAKFDNLPPSRQKEIVRYISYLKTEDSVNRNITKAVNFLLGKDRFVGRDRP